MQENFISILFQKGLTLDEIISLLCIKKLDMQIPKNAFLNIVGNQNQSK